LSLADLENIERRAASAWKEIRMAPLFDAVVVNHDGEDSENWDAFPVPVGEARLALQIVRNGVFGDGAETMESWQPDLFAGKAQPQ
jgi:guanylate kinase